MRNHSLRSSRREPDDPVSASGATSSVHMQCWVSDGEFGDYWLEPFEVAHDDVRDAKPGTARFELVDDLRDGAEEKERRPFDEVTIDAEACGRTFDGLVGAGSDMGCLHEDRAFDVCAAVARGLREPLGALGDGRDVVRVDPRWVVAVWYPKAPDGRNIRVHVSAGYSPDRLWEIAERGPAATLRDPFNAQDPLRPGFVLADCNKRSTCFVWVSSPKR